LAPPPIPTLHELNAEIRLGRVKHAIEMLKTTNPAELTCQSPKMWCEADVVNAVFKLCWHTRCLP